MQSLRKTSVALFVAGALVAATTHGQQSTGGAADDRTFHYYDFGELLDAMVPLR